MAEKRSSRLGADPTVVRPRLDAIKSVTVGDDERTLIVRGTSGCWDRLASVEVEETPASVTLSAYVGLLPRFAAELVPGEVVAVPAVAYPWEAEVTLQQPLGDREVISAGGFESFG